MKYSIESKFTFEYGHILKNAYTTACSENLHGHSGKLFIKITTERIGKNGMVIDFKELKDNLKKYIDTIDHTFFVAYDDERLNSITAASKSVFIIKGLDEFDNNPTAECIAAGIYKSIKSHLPLSLGIINEDFKLEVRLYETENNSVVITE